MAVYSILVKDSVRKDLESVPKGDLQRIMNRIGSLATNPRPVGSEKLTGQDRYRIRQGKYRILYSIHDLELTVWVVKVAHRRDVYR
ncbi:type II toxin-antitoxin system RelE family toxin [Geomonas azotofigens]|uniref:type II toxin-antitoxin system RelE family toxin n=1 Tax=Geomonas azotofigens TaxID=2843196 RepID=UPI001C1206B8|nr:type II toxin-antitoxin system RelE/ParE family toxin [Geomonas azotofigens]MBU5613334.1 type II toxin-antitoxin system RelE/ParE family toxin [Geomonas azotofigens]